MTVWILVAGALILQSAAAVIAVRLIWVTGKRAAWALVATAILLMVFRRLITLGALVSGTTDTRLNTIQEALGFAISLCMFAGLAFVAPLFFEFRRSQQTISHLNGVLHAIRGINQLVARETDRDRLLQGVCRCLTENHTYRHAWLAILDSSSRVVTAVESGIGALFQPIRDGLERGQFPICMERALAVPAGEVVDSRVAECGECPLRARDLGGRAMAVQLSAGHDERGVLVTCLPVSIPVVHEEKALLEEAARDIAFALHGLRMEAERQRTEKDLRLDESRLEALVRLGQMTDATLQQLTDFTLEEAVRLTESRIGYLAFVNSDESVLTMHSWSRSAMAQCQILDKPIVYPVVHTGLWGEAVRQRKPVITNEYTAPNPLKKGYPGGHVPIERHMNLPIFEGERIVIVAGVGNKEEPYDTVDVHQLTLLMQGMWRLVQRQQAEQALQSAHDKLEQRVVERTQELARANAELLRSKEIAEAASRAKSTFLANMSHEIRTPLNAVIGMTELVLKSHLTNQQREFLTTVRDSGEALLSAINDILDFSKIEAGKLRLEHQPFNLWENLGDTMKSFALRAHQLHLELAYHVHPDVPHLLLGDYSRLRQIVVNLVGNALKFTQQGEVVLEVWCESLSATHAMLHFRVSDTGIGISADKQTVIFEMFEQADASMTRRHGGTGLGLAIAARLAEMMEGRIWVESQLERGSQFHFMVRLGLADPEHPLPPSPEPPCLHGVRALIVDDNATNRRILEEVLCSWHMEPTTVDNATAALQILRQAQASTTPFRLVLTDAHMPDFDGFQLAEQIRNDILIADTVVIMLTSGDHPDDSERCQQLGIAGYLLKPSKQSELLEAIEMALGLAVEPRASAEITELLSRSHGNLRILLAEDSLFNQKLAVALLEGQHHSVTVVNNGQEAVTAVEAQTFDLVLMDVQMPIMDGLEATSRIRKRERETGVHVPIIAMTAHALKGDRERCLAAGMDGYVPKPIRAKELFEAMELPYDKRQAPGETEAK